MKNTLLTLAFIILFAASAFAYDGRTITTSINVGVISPAESSVLGVDTELGYSVSGDFHYYFNDYIGIGGFLTYTGTPLEEFDDPLEAIDNIDTTFSSFILGLSASLRFPMEHLDFFINAGVGLAFNEWEQEYKKGGIAYKATDDDNGIAFKFDVGARYFLTDMLSLGLNVGYIINEMDATLRQNSTEETVDLGGVTVAISAGFSF